MKATDETNKNRSGSFERIFCGCVKATNDSHGSGAWMLAGGLIMVSFRRQPDGESLGGLFSLLFLLQTVQ